MKSKNSKELEEFEQQLSNQEINSQIKYKVDRFLEASIKHEYLIETYGQEKVDNLVKNVIDLFDFDPKNNRAGIGILIKNSEDRAQGFGAEALELLINFAFQQLNLNQLFANINPENIASMGLFAKFGFENIGIKKQWNLVNGLYKDEVLFQLINKK